jgi:glycosyltransferase involved in cell wall biosynthesis
MILLSFIIPVYNCEAYVADCLHSIYRIPLKEELFEIILVDDGSTDQSGEIIAGIASHHRNITYIKQENQGASSARNQGLDIAVGKWIWFVDADDRIVVSKKIVEILIGEDAEVVCFSYCKLYKNYKVDVNEFQNEVITGVEYLQHKHSLYLWNKIYRGLAIGNHRMLNGTKNLEDLLFNLQLLVKFSRIICVDTIGYMYNQMNTSSTSKNNNINNLKKLSEDTVSIHYNLKKYICGLEDNVQKFVLTDYLNWSSAGYLYSLMQRYPINFIKIAVCKYRDLGFYPVPKSSYRKQNLFLIFANHYRFFIMMCYVHRIKRVITDKLNFKL